jgi:hypothetical protein
MQTNNANNAIPVLPSNHDPIIIVEEPESARLPEFKKLK